MCLNCGSNNTRSLCNCPFTSPNGKKTERWKDRAFQCETKQKDFRFECTVRLNEGKTIIARSKAVKEFWTDIKVAYDQSIFRDFVGIRKSGTVVILPPDTVFVDPGSYDLVSRTHYLNDEELDDEIRLGVERLSDLRPFISVADLRRIEEELLLLYTHFSLSNERNNLKLDETRVLKNLLVGEDWKHEAADDDEVDVIEATNHILISQDLSNIAKPKILLRN
jgi:hypothetical protein